MARTKQTARKSTGGKAPRKMPLHGQPFPHPQTQILQQPSSKSSVSKTTNSMYGIQRHPTETNDETFGFSAQNPIRLDKNEKPELNPEKRCEEFIQQMRDGESFKPLTSFRKISKTDEGILKYHVEYKDKKWEIFLDPNYNPSSSSGFESKVPKGFLFFKS